MHTSSRFHRTAAVAVPLLALALSRANGQILTDTSVAYQIDAQHTGAVTIPGLTMPFIKENWSVNLGARISYPLVAQGKVFVTVGDNSSKVALYALDAATGSIIWGPIALSASRPSSEAAYDNGKVFVVVDKFNNSTMNAYDAATGTLLWLKPLAGQYAFSSPPTAGNGMVYTGGAGSGGTLYALQQSDGQKVWSASVRNGDKSAPVVTADGVYVSYSGVQTYRFNPLTGALMWHYDSGISGGGGKTAVLYNGNLYVRGNSATINNSGLILNSTTGTSVGKFAGYYGGTAPAFVSGRGFFMLNGTLAAQDLLATTTFWSIDNPSDAFVTAPLVINGNVVEGTSFGKVYIYDGVTGNLLKTLDAGTSIYGPDEQNSSQPLTGLGAGAGQIFVPAGNTLVAFGSSLTTVSGRVALEGINDLKAVSPGAPLGTFHIELRGSNPFAGDVILTPVSGTRFGTFTLNNVPADSYTEVLVKGSKYLRVSLGPPTVNGPTNLPDVTLPTGDINNDNQVNITDFGLLVNAYGSAFGDSSGLYDPRADFNGDGYNDLGDFGLFVNRYGESGAP